MADPTAALGQVFSTFLSYKDRQADREVRLGELERRKVADEDTAEYRANVIEQQRLDREESIRQFNLGQVAVDAETRWRDSETAINTNKEKRTAREEKAVFSFNLAQQVQFDGKNYVQYGVNGRVLHFDEEVLANAIEAGNKTALSLLAQMYNDQPRTDESAGFQVTADSASTPMQRGPNGEMLRVAGGEYPDGGAGVISEEGSSASDDPPALATSLEQAKQLNSYLRNDVLSRSAYGTNLRNNVSSGLTAISSRDAALESLQADLTGDVGVALDGMATQQGTREAISMARSFKAAHANATPEEQRRMVLDMADFLELEVDPALRDAPTEIIGERGTKELGTREEIQTTGSALGGFSHTIADVPIKDTDFNESVKADRRKLTGLEGKINQTTKALDSDTLSPTEREAEQKKLSNLYEERRGLVNTTNANIFNKTEEEITGLQKDIKNAPNDTNLQDRLAKKQEERQALIKAGVRTPAMEKEEYKELEQQMFSKETLALIDEADPAAIRAAFGEIDQHIQNGTLNISEGSKKAQLTVLEQHGVKPTLDSLMSEGSVRDQVITSAILLSDPSLSKEQQRDIRQEMSNLLETGHRTLGFKDATVAASNMTNSDANILNATTRIGEASTASARLDLDRQIMIQDLTTAQREEATGIMDLFYGSKDSTKAKRDEALDGRIDALIRGSVTQGLTGEVPDALLIGETNASAEAASIFREIDSRIDNLVERDALGQIVSTSNPTALNILLKGRDRLSMGVIQNLARENEGMIDWFANPEFTEIFGATSLNNLRADSTDPSKVTEFWMVDGNGENIGGAISREDLRSIPEIERYLLSRVLINSAGVGG